MNSSTLIIFVIITMSIVCLLCMIYKRGEKTYQNDRKDKYKKIKHDDDSEQTIIKRDTRPLFVAKAIPYISSINNSLDTSLVDYLVKDKQNPILISPTSLLLCSSLLLSGASGKSLTELSSMFGVKDVNLFINNLILCNNFAKKFISSKNYVVYRNDIVLKKSYLNLVEPYASNESFKVGETLKLVHYLNNKVSTDTHGMIKKIFGDEDLTDETIIVLLNTIYFKGSWANKFNKSLTKPETFYGISGDKQIDMMNLEDEKHYYYEDEQKQILGMDYLTDSDTDKSIKMSMVFVLPKNSNDVYENMLFSEVSQVFESRVKIDVKLPKFEKESSMDLIPFFKDSGANSIFENAELENMVDYEKSKIKERMYVSKIIQKVKIIVDEEGTEAASSTAISVNLECARPPSAKKTFIANKPFRFYVIMNESLVLFSGIYD